MSFSETNGYVPLEIADIMSSIRTEINIQFGTTYTAETFVGTNWYKYFYALAQRVQAGEIKTSEIFLKIQEYYTQVNARISRPVATPPGIIEKLETPNEEEEYLGYKASVKPPEEEDAGKIFICVDVDDEAEDYDDVKEAICEIIKESVAGGVITQGSESTTFVLSNGQSFDFKFSLPNRIEVLLRLTTTLSENNQQVIPAPEDVKALLIANIAASYRLGKNFEPQRYFTIADAPHAGQVLLEYSLDDGDTWLSEIYEANYDDIFEILLENVELVEE
jgi:hypothetical protein